MPLPPRHRTLPHALRRLTAVATVLAAAALFAPVVAGPGSPPSSTASATSAAAPERPGIVLVVMDDFSIELLSTMRQGQRMRREGADFRNAFVVNTLCCPSRAATLTGLPPHLNGVLTNTADGPGGAKGGYAAFAQHGNLRRTLNLALQRSGYRTGFVGKYMNEFEPQRFGGRLPLPPGWDDFEALTGSAYSGWGFSRTERRGGGLVLRHYPTPAASAAPAVKDRSYATNVVSNRALSLLRDYRRGGKPFFLYVAPYGPHSRLAPAWPGEPTFPAAFRDRPSASRPDGNCGRRSCGSLGVRDLPGFGDRPGDNAPTYLRNGRVKRAPAWRPPGRRMPAPVAARLLRDRARMVQSIDRMVGRIRKAAGPDTYVVLTSDNGFHLGQHGMRAGKGTPYDSDTRVPLLVVGPDVEPGRRVTFASNLDLASTIEDLAGARPSGPRAGRSLVPQLDDPGATGNDHVFFEHTHGPVLPGEPDAEAGSGGRLDAIPSYVAVRSARGLLVRVDLDDRWRGTRYAWELYDYRKRSWEQRNTFARQHDEAWVRDLRRRLVAWADCAPAECRRLAG